MCLLNIRHKENCPFLVVAVSDGACGGKRKTLCKNQHIEESIKPKRAKTTDHILVVQLPIIEFMEEKL